MGKAANPDASLLSKVSEQLITGKAAPLMTAFLSLIAVRMVALPLHGTFAKALVEFYPSWMWNLCHPVKDATLTLMGVSGLAAYIITAMCFCTTLDVCFPSLARRFKAQGERSYFTRAEWLQATGVALTNLFFFSWLVVIPVYAFIQRDGVLRGRTAPREVTDALHLPTALMHTAIHGIVIDVWFFSTHIALHWPPLYRAIHKRHHRFKAPTAVACMYAHPLEFCIGNVMGVILGPALTNPHPYVAAFWMAFALTSTSMSHSGYLPFGALHHDQHHEHFDYNFGVAVFMDKLFGTGFHGSAREKAILGKRL